MVSMKGFRYKSAFNCHFLSMNQQATTNEKVPETDTGRGVSRTRPRVSVLIPTHNRAASLERALASLQLQDYPEENLEIIIIDDGSTDTTPEVIEAWRQRLGENRLKAVRISKGNITHAKNAGLEVATGEIIVTTDDDCTFEPDWLSTLVMPFQDATVGAVGGHDQAPDIATSPLAAAVDYTFTGFLGTGGVRRGGRDARLARFYPRGCNMAFRKSLLDKTGVFDTLFFNGEEIDLDYRIREAGYRLVCQPRCTVHHHRRADWRGLARQLLGRGITRRMLFLKHPEYREVSYWLPALLVLGLLGVLLAAGIFPVLRWPVFAGVWLYLALLGAGGLHCLLTRNNPVAAVRVPVVLLMQHFIYGIGMLTAPFFSSYQVLRQTLRFQTRMRRARRPLRVLISNDGFGPNQGDKAILEVMKADLAAHFPGVEIRGFLNSWVPGWRDIRQFFGDLIRADIFLMGGGQVLHDQTCLLFLFAALLKMLAAQVLRTPVVCYAVGAGPLSFSFGRRMTRLILNRCVLVMVRDQASENLLKAIGVTTPPIKVTADPAFCLQAASAPPLPFTQDDGPLIVVCPRRWFHYGQYILPVRRRAKNTSLPGAQDQTMSAVLATVIGHLTARHNARVLLVPMKPTGPGGRPGQDDDVLCREIYERCQAKDRVAILADPCTPAQVKTVLCAAHLVITMRMHAMIMGAGCGVPFIGISLSEKFSDLAGQLAMSDYLIPIQEINIDNLNTKAEDALNNRREISRQLAPRAARLAERARLNIALLAAWVGAPVGQTGQNEQTACNEQQKEDR
ncbi:MAG: glycosyltransferase [Spartobacteria bacterium]|nr:glycosyltransferase [Spartobacteria bacterium]